MARILSSRMCTIRCSDRHGGGGVSQPALRKGVCIPACTAQGVSPRWMSVGVWRGGVCLEGVSTLKGVSAQGSVCPGGVSVQRTGVSAQRRGCLPLVVSAQESVCPGGVSARGCLPTGVSAKGGLPGGASAERVWQTPPGRHPLPSVCWNILHPLVNKITDACENITLPATMLRMVKMKEKL